jgi:hypothetical protein
MKKDSEEIPKRVKIKNKRKYNLSAYQIKHKLEQREDDEQDEREYEQDEREYEQQFNSNNG